MIENCLLTILIETYNQECFIKQTIESILNQDYWFDYEIIIGDDCSTDKTPVILDEYAKRFPQIKVIHNPKNLGAMGNYYNIVTKAKGKYIMDCAGDDYWLPGKVKKQILYLEKHPNIGMCYGTVKVLENSEFLDNLMGFDKPTFKNLLYGNRVPALTVCFRNNLFKKYYKDVEPQNKPWLMEDYPLWLWLSKESRIKFFPDTFGVYRILSESASHSIDSVKVNKFNESIYQIKDFYSKKYNKEKLLEKYIFRNTFNSFWATRNYKEIVQIAQKKRLSFCSIKMIIKIHYSYLMELRGKK